MHRYIFTYSSLGSPTTLKFIFLLEISLASFKQQRMQQHMSYYSLDATLTLTEASESLPWAMAGGPPVQLSNGGLFPMEPHGFQCNASDHQVVQPVSTLLDAKALASSRNHSEAERQRRERINAHLAKLRSLLPSTTKTDKASLLAEVIQHMKDLKRHASELAETTSPPFPSESDELIVDSTSYEHGRCIVKASICCNDRSDLLPDLINTLKSLRLRVLKAEITSLGGRVRNVLFITGEEECGKDNYCSSEEEKHRQSYLTRLIEEALKAVVEKPNRDLGSARMQRPNESDNEYR